MNSKDREVRKLRRQINRSVRRGSGVLKWDAAGEEIIYAIGQLVDETDKEMSREHAARLLGIEYHQLDYAISKYRKLLKFRPKNKAAPKPKLAQVKVIDDEPATASQIQTRSVGSLELVLESGIRVAVNGAEQAAELLERLDRQRGRRAA